MGKSGTAKPKLRTGRSLNLVLWFSFSVFAVLLIVVFSLLQNLLARRQNREVTAKMLTEAGERVVRAFSESDNPTEIAQALFKASNEYGVGFYLVYENGESVYPEFAKPEDVPELTEELRQTLSSGESVLLGVNGTPVFCAEASLANRTCYLFLSPPAASFAAYTGGFRWVSVVAALFAIVLAFIASGVVATLITNPVSEVTERAKELARGNYAFEFKKEYFCLEMTELAEALDGARLEITKADQVQKELIANVSHDFKTPLTMIKAYASMIREISGDDKEKRDAHAQIIIDESDRLAALVGDLLDLSRLRAGLTDESRVVFNLSEEVYRVAGRFDYLSQTEGYRIETAVEDEIYALACKERIVQVLYNLIGNAVNYTGADKRVLVKLFRTDAGARFEVVDSGKGIPPEEIDTIWDRYYRSNKTHKRPVQGTGLGLSIVKGILLAQGCPFGVVSEVGKGSCFWVEFPLPEDDPFAEGQTAEKEGKKKTRKRKKEEEYA